MNSCDLQNPPQNKLNIITQSTSDKLKASGHKPRVSIHHLWADSLDALGPAFRGWIDQGLHCPRPEQTYTGVQDLCRVLGGGQNQTQGRPQKTTNCCAVGLVPLRGVQNVARVQCRCRLKFAGWHLGKQLSSGSIHMRRRN